MSYLNRAEIIGYLGADPEMRQLNNGNDVVSFSVATTKKWKDKDGEDNEKTEWHRIVIYNENIGRVADKYLRKGSQVFVSGEMQTRKWEDRDGNDRYTTEIVLGPYDAKLVLLGGPDDGNRSRSGRDDRGSSRGRDADDDRRPSGRRDRDDDGRGRDRHGDDGRRGSGRRDDRNDRANDDGRARRGSNDDGRNHSRGRQGTSARREEELDDEIPF